MKLRHATPEFRTYCGDEALAALPRELERAGVHRVILVSGASMVDRYGQELARVETVIGGRLAGRFNGVREHSPLPDVESARDAIHDSAADGIVVVGGGSAIVTARAASILLAEGRDARELCTHRNDDGKLVSPRLGQRKLPAWIVPTTPTTAYAKAGAAVRDPQTGDRLAMFDPGSRAQGIFLDPKMALTAPPSLVEASALNAFSMAVEGLQSDVDDPLAEALFLQALRILSVWMVQLRSAPQDSELRLRLMLAALLSGQGSDHVGGGLAQALSHVLGPRSSASNGVVEAIMLPHVMRYNAPVVGRHLAAVAGALGRRSSGTEAEIVEAAPLCVRQILDAMGVPGRLRDIGIAADVLPEAVAHAADDWAVTRVPRAAGSAQLEEILEAAW